MQIFSTCGLTIEYNDINHNEYLNLKNRIEKFGKECVKLAKECEKNPFMRHIRLYDTYYLTCTVVNNKPEIAIYNSTAKELVQHISLDSNIKILKTDFDDLYIRVYSYAKTKDNPIIEPLQSIWDEYLKERDMESERE